MPNVPVYSSNVVTPTALPGVRQQTPYRQMQAASIGPQENMRMGEALTAAGGELMREVTLDQIATNEAAAKDFDAQHMGANQAVLNEYMSLKGKNAVEGFDAAAEKLGKIPQELEDKLQNPAQRELVKHLSEMRMTSAMGQLAVHKREQTDVYEDSASQTRIKVAQDAAAVAYSPVLDKAGAEFNHDNPTANTPYQQYLQTIRSETEDRADRKGLTDPDLRAAFVKEAMGAAYMGTLSRLIDAKGGKPADIKLAQAYFDEVKGELSNEQQVKVRNVLEAGAIKNDALNLAIDLGSKIGGIGGQEKELNRLFKNGDINADVHALALQHLRADNSQRRSEQAESDKSMLGQIWDLSHKGGKLTDLSPAQLSYIKNRGLGPSVDAILKQGEPGGNAGPDDAKLYSDLSRMSVEDPAKFIAMDLATVSGQLSQAHFNHLIGTQTSINRQDVKGMEANKVLHTAVQDAKSGLLAAGFDLTPKEGTQKAKDYQNFEASLRDAIVAAQPGWQEQKLNPAQMREEARKITLGMLKDQTLSNSGWIWDTKLPIWKMTPEQRAASWTITDADRTRIKGQLAAGGMPATEANIQQYYKLEQGAPK